MVGVAAAVILLVLATLLVFGVPWKAGGQSPGSTGASPTSSNLATDPRVAVALADPRVQSLLASKKYRVLEMENVGFNNKDGLPGDAVYVKIFDYTDNYGIWVVVTTNSKVLSVLYPRGIALVDVERAAAYTVVKGDPRFQTLTNGKNYNLYAVEADGANAPECATQRCADVHVALWNPSLQLPPGYRGNSTQTPSGPGGYQVAALFIVNLATDTAVNVIYISTGG